MSSRRRGRRTQQMEAIARERIAHLLEQAERWALEGRQDDADARPATARLPRLRWIPRSSDNARASVAQGMARYHLFAVRTC